MPRSFAVRGVVEGFYGTPWTHAARIDVISFLAPRGMNAYVYAPKDDVKHRAAWREPYAPGETDQFRALAMHCRQHDVRFGFAISPGLDIDYDARPDRNQLLAKLSPLRDAGVDWFLLFVDDIPMRADLAAGQAALGSWLRSELGDCALSVCPTEYVGTRPSPYLSDLSTGLPDDVDLMWTGPTVCSPTITADDARGWTKAVSGRRVIVWDNYPVNDALMTNSLHLGAYQGREPDLVDVVGGVLCNPMTQAHASLIALATAMDFLRDPDGYDEDHSWANAIVGVGRERAPALAALATACADSPIARPENLPMAEAVAGLASARGGPSWIAAVAELAEELRRVRALPDAFPASADGSGPDPADPLAAEVAPWARAARAHAEAGLAALRLFQQVRPVATVDGAVGRAAAPAPHTAMEHVFVVMFLWAGARADEKVVFGPRFALYTPVVQLPDGSPAVDAAAAVREDANAIDRLCRLALATYDDWRLTAATEPLRVFVDGKERVIAADGRFDATGTSVLVHQDMNCTRVEPGTALPFTDPRLS